MSEWPEILRKQADEVDANARDLWNGEPEYVVASEMVTAAANLLVQAAALLEEGAG